jgi:hypothetical protein
LELYDVQDFIYAEVLPAVEITLAQDDVTEESLK